MTTGQSPQAYGGRSNLTFLSRTGPAIVRIVPGWADESLAVESPSGPALPVQRLARTPGWHRLDVRFSPDTPKSPSTERTWRTAKGRRARWSRSASGVSPPAEEAPVPDPPQSLACHIDDLQLTRFAEPPAKFELDISQDDARLVTGRPDIRRDHLGRQRPRVDDCTRPAGLAGLGPGFRSLLQAQSRPPGSRSRDSWRGWNGVPGQAKSRKVLTLPKAR